MDLELEDEHGALILAYLIYDHDKTLTHDEVIQMAKKVVYACDEFGLGFKAGIEYVAANPSYGVSE